MNDGDVTAQALHDFEYVRSKKNRGAARDHALQHRLQSSGGDSVDAFEGFVEEENFGAVNYGGGHGEFFLHAVGIIGDQLFRLIGELHEVEEFGGALGGGLAVESVHAAGEVQELGAGEASEERHPFGDDSDLTLHFHWILLQVKAEDFDAARAGRKQAGEHFDGRRFARAVGAEKTEELSRGHAEIDAVDSDQVSEAAGQTLSGDCGSGVHETSESSTDGRIAA